MKLFVVASLVRGASFVLAHIPLSVALWIGKTVAHVCFYVHKRKWVAYANLRAAFPGKYDAQTLKRIVKESYGNLGQTFVELLCFPYLNDAYGKKNFEFMEGSFDRISNALRKGQGVVFLTAHLDNWELAGYYAAFCGFPLKVLVTEQKKHSVINDLLNAYRESVGNTVIGKGFPLRELVTALKENSLVAIVGDQAGRKGDVYMRFFGRLATSHDGAFRIAQRNGSAILPCIMERLPKGRHRVSILDELAFGDSPDNDTNIKQALKKYLAILEQAIEKNPGQWMWGHKRWKHCKTKRILIVSDAKPGHENQSLAIYDMLTTGIAGDDKVPYEFEKTVVRISYRSSLAKRIVQMGVWLCLPFMRGRLSVLRPFLTKESYDSIIDVHADIVISCGSAAVPIAVALKHENLAKNVCVMKPALPYSLVHHDVIITHAHDVMEPQQNIVETFVAPSRITRERMGRISDVFRATYSLNENKKYMAVLIGGNTKGYFFDRKKFTDDVVALINSAKKLGMRIIATNSRRTPDEISTCMKELLAQSEIADMYIDVRENNPDDCVYGMMSVSDIICVTEESVSMTSEAVQSAKKVVVFSPSNNRLADKHIRFQNELITRGVLERFNRRDAQRQFAKIMSKTQDYACIDTNRHTMQHKLHSML